MQADAALHLSALSNPAHKLLISHTALQCTVTPAMGPYIVSPISGDPAADTCALIWRQRRHMAALHSCLG